MAATGAAVRLGTPEAGLGFSASTCSNLLMQSRFMLVLWSLASAFRASCRLSGSRTVMTRVGSLTAAAAALRLRSILTIC